MAKEDNEDIALFRREHPLDDEDRPDWGQILALMADMEPTHFHRPFRKFYNTNAIPFISVLEGLEGKGHSREAILWALDCLIDWGYLGCRRICHDLCKAPVQQQLHPEIVERLPPQEVVQPKELSLIFLVLVFTDQLPDWQTYARLAHSAPNQGEKSNSSEPIPSGDVSRGHVPEENAEKSWVPPAVGWGFEKARYSYNGQVHDLSGIPFKLLQIIMA